MAGSRDLVEHLRFLAELGVEGVSREQAWRRRPSSAATPPAAPPRVEDVAAGMASSQAGDPAGALHVIRADLGECTRCKLHAGRTHLVFGVGNPSARLMFIGEGPGQDEDLQGIPFVGKAGQLLTQIVKAMGYERDQVYIANVVKCRPPNNRNPEPDEIEACEPFLWRQIEAVRPAVIVALGKFAAQTLLRTSDPISRLRGRFATVQGIPIMPTFHPSYLLRTPSAKREVWEDMKQVMGHLSTCP